jgi:hypothetical protein
MDILQVVQQCSAQVGVEDSWRHIQGLGQNRKQMQCELADVKDHLEEASVSLPPSLSHLGPK